MNDFITIVSACVVAGFWLLVLLAGALLIWGYYRRHMAFLEDQKLDRYAETLGWSDYETLKEWIGRSLYKHQLHTPDQPLAVERAYQKGLEAGATIATKAVMRGLVAEINRRRPPNNAINSHAIDGLTQP